MTFQTLKSSSISLAIFLFAAPAALAAAPAARVGARAVYDEVVETVVMFGGVTTPDAATGRAYEPDDTWEFDGTRWIRRFVQQAPPGRSSHVMVYDSNRDQSVIFGGRAGSDLLNDTWAYRGDWSNRNWVKIETPNAPAAREFAAAAFDAARDRIVLFGGRRFNDDKTQFVQLYDTWEFDGTTWTRVVESGPEVQQPLLAFDAARNELILMGNDGSRDLVTKMYTYDASARAWNAKTPDALPPCVNESSMTYDSDTQRVFLIGGVCVPTDTTKSSPTTEELWAWDGTNWTKVEDERILFRSTNAAFTYDAKWKSLVLFGGALAYTTSPRSDTNMYRDENWISPPFDVTSPSPRSLYAMASDPVNRVIWLFGGLGEDSFPVADLWKFQDGFWHRVEAENTPGCEGPVAAYDTNRSRLVVVCRDSETHEWDGEKWTKFENLKTKPESRRFSHLVYDQSLRKTVLYGGFNPAGDYLNKTWTWDGTAWTEVKSNKRPHFRALAAMWYDPTLRKTVLYGGIGRREREGRLERFSDIWSFDGSAWTELKPSAVPPTRYGAQIAVDPTTGRAILFGGLKLETENGIQKQVYANDTWEWNGSAWRQLQTEGAPPPRENAAMAWDYSGKGFIMFGGWAGYYLSDTWRFSDNRWTAFAE